MITMDLSLDQIADATELSLEEIKKLQHNLKDCD